MPKINPPLDMSKTFINAQIIHFKTTYGKDAKKFIKRYI